MINTGQPGLMLDDRQARVAIDELLDDRCALRAAEQRVVHRLSVQRAFVRLARGYSHL